MRPSREDRVSEAAEKYFSGQREELAEIDRQWPPWNRRLAPAGSQAKIADLAKAAGKAAALVADLEEG